MIRISEHGILSTLQIVHLALLVLIPTTYTILVGTSAPNDRAILNLGIALGAGGAAWSGIVTVLAIARGSRDGVLQSLWVTYRALLIKLPFVVLTVLVLGAAQMLLSWQLFAYRSVRFLSAVNVDVLLNDQVGVSHLIGTVEANKETSLRLRLGTRHLAFRAVTTGDITVLPPVQIKPWWSRRDTPRLRVPLGKNYEMLK